MKGVKKSTQLQMINIILFGIVIAITFISSLLVTNLRNCKEDIQTVTEQAWRGQARRTLDDLKVRLLDDVKNGLVNPNDNKSLQVWCQKNLVDIRNGGPTSDGFMVDMSTEQFIWDGSNDCARPDFLIKGRYLKDEPALHQDPKLATEMINIMRKEFDTQYGDNYYWRFDDSPELLEWVIVPKSMLGFNDEPATNGGVKNEKYKVVLIQLGTQTDEIMKPYEDIIKSVDTKILQTYMVTGLALVISIISMFVIMILYKGDGGDDK